MLNYLRLATVVIAALTAFAASSLAQTFLLARDVAAILADGKPWSASAPNGRSSRLTLDEDGSRSIRGPLPVPLATTWSIKGDELCIANRMLSKCLRFSTTPEGMQGWEHGKLLC